MLRAVDVRALVGASHGDPFAVLGLHADDKGALWLRTMLPGATSVAVVDAKTGKRVAALVNRLARRCQRGRWHGQYAGCSAGV